MADLETIGAGQAFAPGSEPESLDPISQWVVDMAASVNMPLVATGFAVVIVLVMFRGFFINRLVPWLHRGRRQAIPPPDDIEHQMQKQDMARQQLRALRKQRAG